MKITAHEFFFLLLQALKFLRAEIDRVTSSATEFIMDRKSSAPTESEDEMVEYFISKLNPFVDNIKAMCEQQDGLLTQVCLNIDITFDE